MAGKQGRGARARAKQRRLRERRIVKQANRARWDKYRDMGMNRKDKSKRSRKKRRNNLKGTHPFNPCGNLACSKCYIQAEHKPRQWVKFYKAMVWANNFFWKYLFKPAMIATTILVTMYM
jgi:hypothetical protein